MNADEIRAKIAHTQELLNIEQDQNKKNELHQDLKVLKMRLDMDSTHEKIKKLTNRD
ncbi:hypothetical protein [Winogradskyella sp. A2]|uniref:hypothetical protein n=1 Tax=Winogradskyella sp. A2 TaxID=3366944 RepID=UPI00398C76D6